MKKAVVVTSNMNALTIWLEAKIRIQLFIHGNSTFIK